MASQVKELTFEAPITPANSQEFKNEMGVPCKGIMLVSIVNNTNPNEVFSAAPFIQFANSDNGIKLYNITGLTAGNKYTIRIICLAGP